uniref:Sema domain-containing protein n=1 Tax=Neogobius melanostomus TaxID=47308 RepID=A0A8C6UA90_9GOBI
MVKDCVAALVFKPDSGRQSPLFFYVELWRPRLAGPRRPFVCETIDNGLIFVWFAAQMECQNYIRVLLVNKTEVMTCGTNAFQPLCITRVLERVNGVARCPYDPRHNSTAVVTESGELYAATVIDFSGRDPVIYRSLGHLPPLRTAQYNSKWLNEPHFISAYDIGLFTFFFLRENAVEHDCGKTVYSRVARVCKNDIGGRFLLEDTWTTFMKARLNCSRSGEIPFYYNELQSTFYLPEQDLIYGIFTTNVNSIAASAVCAFNLSAITQAFNGPFRSQENPRSTWLPTPNPIHNFQCGTISERGPNEGLTERSLQDAQRLYLMNDVVQPETTDPLVMQDDVRFSGLVVDIVQGMDTLYHVIYISTGAKITQLFIRVLCEYVAFMTLWNLKS